VGKSVNYYKKSWEKMCIYLYKSDFLAKNRKIQSQTNNYQDEYKDKYIKMLEAEIERLR